MSFSKNILTLSILAIASSTTFAEEETKVQQLATIEIKANVFPNPTNDFIAVQLMGLNKENLKVELFDETGKLIQTASILAGATNTYLDIRTLYSGNYLVKISGTNTLTTKKIVVQK